jgi:hypothetical protein
MCELCVYTEIIEHPSYKLYIHCDSLLNPIWIEYVNDEGKTIKLFA